MSSSAKRYKRQRLLTDLPEDLLEIIFSHLLPSDVKSLSLVCREFRERLVIYMFKHIKATWDQIIDLHKNKQGTAISQYRHLVRSLRIIEANSFNEYQQKTFGTLLSPSVLPNLIRVTVNSDNLSYWLKYNESFHIRSLSLYSDKEVNSIKIFHLSHIAGLHGLRQLCLSKYHFNWIEEEAPNLSTLETLSLQDCTWEYPFNLEYFNHSDSLHDLSITYSNNNPFILLERFINFLEAPFPSRASSLRNIKISFFGITCNKKFLTMTIFSRLLHTFDALELLVLEGWTANLAYLRTGLKQHKFRFPTSIKLSLECFGDLGVREFVADCETVPNLKLSVDNVLGN